MGVYNSIEGYLVYVSAQVPGRESVTLTVYLGEETVKVFSLLQVLYRHSLHYLRYYFIPVVQYANTQSTIYADTQSTIC